MKITDKDRERNDMKKILCLFLTVLCISLPGCGSGNAYNDTQILVNEAGSESGIENYNKVKIIEEYSKDIDSGLFLFPNETEKMMDATFASNLKTGFFDTDGYIILQAKYKEEDYEAEVERLSNIECSVMDVVLGVQYDTESYSLPAYVAVDGFDHVYEYALIDRDNCKITYVLLSYPEDVDLNEYEQYLKLDMSEYMIKDTLKCFSIYVRQSKNDTYIEYSE